eukprot:TRINITY_DN4226_c0_g2_i2.p1 TRINITY_DN4226_c0_g2~~TRINITY_DN4226_c0_g2_i2.p1  ORF type:complete len:464 (+),score=97.31 TRINITY_DN4226_c0_g2_i2:33-1424(+)
MCIRDSLNTHNYTTNPGDTIKVVLEAGMDIDCGSFVSKYGVDAVKAGYITEKQIDHALADLFTVQMRLGIFDPADLQPYKKFPPTLVNSAAHQKLALTAARDSLTLLKNNGALPFDSKKIRTIALLGPNANATTTMQGNYYGHAPYLISPMMGLELYATVAYAQGCDIDSQDKGGFAYACQAASTSDATVLVMGLDQSQEREGHDRDIISFPGVQGEFIDTVAECASGPLILVMMNGGPVDLSVQKVDDRVAAIVWVGYPGQSGGQAIAEMLYGEFSPAGRLPYTVYPADFVNKVSMFDMGMRPNASNGNPGRTYRFYTGEAVYPFGYGLSYTQFEYNYDDGDAQDGKVLAVLKEEHVAEELGKLSPGDLYVFAVNVTNVGKVASADSVLAFIEGPDAGTDGNPIRSLFNYAKVFLKAGESQIVSFGVGAEALSVVTLEGARKAVAGRWKVSVGEAEKVIIVE